MLYELEGICEYLHIPIPEKLEGRKGKAKMKSLHRSCGATYHEGEKALSLIKALDFKKILEKAPIDLEALKQHLLK